MIKAALTPEQQRYAADHHRLVYAFLHLHNLDENDFYDVVVFGFLDAAREYLTSEQLRQCYAFSTIAFRKMHDALSRYRREQNRSMRKAYTVSLDAAIFGDEETLSLHEALSSPDAEMLDLETELLMRELASKISKRDMDLIRMTAEGYSIQEIADTRKTTAKRINDGLAALRDTVLAVCHE